MSQKYDKLKSLLRELFQLDQPDLDFGLYRVMHAKSAEVSTFLDRDLLPQVQTAFGQYKTADKAEMEKELARVIAGIEAAGMDPAQSAPRRGAGKVRADRTLWPGHEPDVRERDPAGQGASQLRVGP